MVANELRMVFGVANMNNSFYSNIGGQKCSHVAERQPQSALDRLGQNRLEEMQKRHKPSGHQTWKHAKSVFMQNVA